eukprot:m.888203 g.888203  ORF g.888203 m.888203 type:complete len:59 (+) comp59925_c1_seq16:1131-1307(+)
MLQTTSGIVPDLLHSLIVLCVRSFSRHAYERFSLPCFSCVAIGAYLFDSADEVRQQFP